MVTIALARLIELLEVERDYKAAIGYAVRLRQLGPFDEDTHRTLMRLHAANEDRAGVLHSYRTCVRTLKDEFGASPSPETRELCERLLKSAVVHPSPVVVAQDQPPLVGRRREWQMLQAAWRTACRGSSRCVILAGDAGIGKTRLAEELMTWASRQGYTVAAARCYAAEGALAYAPVVAWLRSSALHARLVAMEAIWATEAARLLPELLTERPDLTPPGPAGEVSQRRRLFEALARATLHREDPLLLTIDDLQWCDRDSLEWLHYLLRFEARSQLLLVGTVRLEDAGYNVPLATMLSALRSDDRLTEIMLAPLDAEQTASLAISMSDLMLTPEQLTRLFQETEGNPLFIVEMMRFGLAAQAGDVETAGPGMAATSLPIPPRMHSILHVRLSQLSVPARELAGVAAAIGREFLLPVLAKVSDQDEDRLVRSLDELWQRRIVVEAPGQGPDVFDFTHDKLRKVVYNSLSAVRRRLLHRRIAEALEAVYPTHLGTVSAQIATHCELAGMFERAVLYYQRAAEAARQVYANHDAIGYYQRALALAQGPAAPSAALAADLYHQLGDTLHWTARYEEARFAFQQAIATTPNLEPIYLALLYRKIGNSWRDQHHYPEALLAYTQAERALRPTPPESSPEWWQEWIQILLEITLVHYWLGQTAESDELRARLQPAVEQYGTPGQRALYAQNMAWIEFRRNRHVATAETVALNKAVLAAQIEAGNQAAVPAAQFGFGFALLWSGDLEGAIEALQTALQQAKETDDVSLQARCLTYLTIALRQCNRIEECKVCAARSLEAASAARMPEYIATSKANQGWLAWCAENLDLARALGLEALKLWRELPPGHASAPFQWLARWPLIAVAMREDQLAWAVDCVRALFDPGQQRVPDALATGLEQAVQAWDDGVPEVTRTLLNQSMVLAHQMHCV
jgi:tetratricopeptide (TPR) repeat protein